mmetsp:Transcript_84538/g.149692  ORF Transcript_84538/g.149692 Transcript_84538/m.149692 type:complete len:208 (+) Transcript_84538:51-674(+)
MGSADEGAALRTLRSQAILEIDLLLRRSQKDTEPPWAFQVDEEAPYNEQTYFSSTPSMHSQTPASASVLDPMPQMAPRRRHYAATPTSTCSELVGFPANMQEWMAHLRSAAPLVLSPTSTQGELPPLTAPPHEVPENYFPTQASLPDIPEFRSATMPDFMRIHSAYAKATTQSLASLPSLFEEEPLNPENSDIEEEEAEDNINQFSL